VMLSLMVSRLRLAEMRAMYRYAGGIGVKKWHPLLRKTSKI